MKGRGWVRLTLTPSRPKGTRLEDYTQELWVYLENSTRVFFIDQLWSATLIDSVRPRCLRILDKTGAGKWSTCAGPRDHSETIPIASEEKRCPPYMGPNSIRLVQVSNGERRKSVRFLPNAPGVYTATFDGKTLSIRVDRDKECPRLDGGVPTKNGPGQMRETEEGAGPGSAE